MPAPKTSTSTSSSSAAKPSTSTTGSSSSSGKTSAASSAADAAPKKTLWGRVKSAAGTVGTGLTLYSAYNMIKGPGGSTPDPNAMMDPAAMAAAGMDPNAMAAAGMDPAMIEQAMQAGAAVDPAMMDPTMVAAGGGGGGSMDPAMMDPAAMAAAGMDPAAAMASGGGGAVSFSGSSGGGAVSFSGVTYKNRKMSKSKNDWYCPSDTVDTGLSDDARACIGSAYHPANADGKCPFGTVPSGVGEGDMKCEVGWTMRVYDGKEWKCPDDTEDSGKSWDLGLIEGAKQCRRKKAFTSRYKDKDGKKVCPPGSTKVKGDKKKCKWAGNVS